MTNRLHKEIESLKKNIMTIVAEVEENVRMSVNSLKKRDSKLAKEVIEQDHHIDQREVQLEEECLKILALYQPVANDLRFIIAVMKINNDLERISDLAVNIAERAEFLATRETTGIPFDFSLMADKVQEMLRNSIHALVTLDLKLAHEVCAADDKVDDLNREMYHIVEDSVRRNPENIKELLHYLGVSRHLERIADSATNIAEDIIYMIDGEIVRHHVESYKSHSR
ncbi:MAG: phosphate signaling complex protein PhoU [Candidatus Latescibacteria bacterium]|jgi:phosphate transport system protein|nr:phosphate signaling complex protein PhoU [Candidatus Latescibacterota bacterium]